MSSSSTPVDTRDSILVAREARKTAAKRGERKYECHICLEVFESGLKLNHHLSIKQDEQHADHRERLEANSGISKDVSIAHRERMTREQPEAKRGVGSRVIFIKTGDAIEVTEKLAEEWSWRLAGGRICKMKTEGQTWLWECDWHLRNNDKTPKRKAEPFDDGESLAKAKK
jgi:hypothetical protein